VQKLARRSAWKATKSAARPYTGGPGVGARCAVCAEPVTKTQLEFEIQFATDGAEPGLDKFHTHIRCFAAWEFERRDNGPHT
jgi:hypothetical protein